MLPGMRLNTEAEDGTQTIAQFGAGKLVQTRAGAYVFVGGTRRDELEAVEWTAIFEPEMVFARRDAWTS
jgi:hypothetical protein